MHSTTQYQPPTLSFVLCALFGLFASLPIGVARGQSCHMPALREPDGTSWQANATGIFATYENASYTGEYQGVRALASYQLFDRAPDGAPRHPRLSLEVALPYYRIVRNGLTQHGLGDLGVDARVVAYRSSDQRLSVGPELALTVPTGDAQRDLGMGHVMLMPGAWLKLQQDRLLLIVQAAYGRAATDLHGSGHHHEAVFPLVNPMNMQELEHSIALGYAVHESVELETRLFGAVPINSPMGTARELIAGGARVSVGIFAVGVEVQVPLVGAIFRAKTLLSASARW